MPLPDINLKESAASDDFVLKHQRVDVLTFAAPLLFMILHALFLNLAAMGIAVVYSFVNSMPITALADTQSLERLFLDSQAQNWASVLLGLVMTPIYLIYLNYRRRKYSDILLTDRAPGRYWLTGFSAIMGSLGFSMIWISFLIFLSDSIPVIKDYYQNYIDAVESLQHAEGYFWLEILAVVIMIPIAEELLFRGILQGEVRRVAPGWLAVSLSGIIFALFHVMPFQIAFVIIPGLVLALVYELTRNILIPIFMHMVYNFFGGGIFSRLAGLSDDNMVLFWTEMVFIIIGLVLLFRLILESRQAKKRVKAGV